MVAAATPTIHWVAWAITFYGAQHSSKKFSINNWIVIIQIGEE